MGWHVLVCMAMPCMNIWSNNRGRQLGANVALQAGEVLRGHRLRLRQEILILQLRYGPGAGLRERRARQASLARRQLPGLGVGPGQHLRPRMLQTGIAFEASSDLGLGV